MIIQTVSLGEAHTLPELPGVYWIQEVSSGEVVYVGKADPSLNKRGKRHKRKIASSMYDVKDFIMGCMVLQPSIALAVEDDMIRRYNPKWQKSGFGSNNSCKTRSGVAYTEWDKLYTFSGNA